MTECCGYLFCGVLKRTGRFHHYTGGLIRRVAVEGIAPAGCGVVYPSSHVSSFKVDRSKTNFVEKMRLDRPPGLQYDIHTIRVNNARERIIVQTRFRCLRTDTYLTSEIVCASVWLSIPQERQRMAAAVHIQRRIRGRQARQLAVTRRRSRKLPNVPPYPGSLSIQATKEAESLLIAAYGADRGELCADASVPMAAEEAPSAEADEVLYNGEDGATARKKAEERLLDLEIASGNTYASLRSRLLEDGGDTNSEIAAADDRARVRTLLDGHVPGGCLSEKEIAVRAKAACRIQVRGGITAERVLKSSRVCRAAPYEDTRQTECGDSCSLPPPTLCMVLASREGVEGL